MKSTQTTLSYPSYTHGTRHHSFSSFFNYSKTKKNISTCKLFIIKIAENKTIEMLLDYFNGCNKAFVFEEE